MNLNIVSAHIATFGERAVDVFYVTDLTGREGDQRDPPEHHQAPFLGVFAGLISPAWQNG